MFISSDSGGNIALWNQLEDIDYPIYLTKTDPIFTVSWLKDSQNICVGTLTGKIEIYQLKKVNLKYTEDQLIEYCENIKNSFE